MDARHVAVALFAVALLAVPVAAHTNHVSADAQRTADGTVVVEGAFVATDGFLVVHADDDGAIGAPIGHVPIDDDAGFVTDREVAIAPEHWAGWTVADVWVAFHHDDGDGQFDPEQDPVKETFGDPVATRFTLANGSTAVVTAEGFAPQEAASPTVRVRTAVLPADGHLVLRNGSVDGRVVGHTTLESGTNRNVSVALNDSFYASHDRFALAAVLYTDDGDGRFDAGDAPVRAGDAVVATTFPVNRTGTVTGTPTPIPADASRETDAPSNATATGGQPGFTSVAALLAVLLVAARRHG